MDLAELYRAVVETSPDGIWVLDLHGRTIYANPEIARIHRIPVEDLPRLSVFDTLDAAGRAQFTAHLRQVSRGAPNPGEVEVQWVRSDGTVVWMLASETTLLDQYGQVHALLHRFSDYTARRATLESLRASEEALEDQVAQNNLMQAVASAANEAGSLAEVLAHARELVLLHDDWERARAFLPQDGVLAPFHANDEDRLADLDDPFAQVELELAERCFSSGTVLWDERMLTIAFPIALREEVYGVVAITSAPPLWRFGMIESMVLRVSEQLALVAERERARVELGRARDQAMEASRQKSEFLATMSHEIRTPLNGVIGLNDLLLRSPLDPDQQRLATGVQVASRALLDVINDVLDFSKIEAGRLELERVDFLVRPLLDQVAGLLTEAARDKGLDLVVSCHPDVPATLAGDPTRLAQVVTNLVSNAVKFTEHGEVTVVASPAATVEGDAGDARFRLQVEVRDTGIGVAADRVAGLFEPFTQADASTTRVYGGTGLGLAISREIAEAMGGELRHAPNPDGGSVFTVVAVLDPAASDGEGPEREAATDGDDEARRLLGERRVLVVDDTESDGQVLDEHLTYWGLYADRVISVDAALDRLASAATYDLVLVDLVSPDRDGPLFAARLRSATGPDGPRLLMLAPAAGTDVERLRAAGIDDVLVRPVLPSVLRGALVRLLAGETLTPAYDAPTTAPDRGRVLVVEDNAVNQMVATGLLAALGYTSEVVDDGVAAIEAAHTGGFDAILMDVQMPRMDGYTATREIRAAEGEGPRRPIIAMTAAAIEGERERCLAAGMDDFLSKPVDPAALDAVLARLVSGAGADPATGEAVDQIDDRAPAAAPAAVLAPGGLDLDRLEELRELDSPTASYLDRAIASFTAKSEADYAAICAAVADGDVDTVRHLAHRSVGGALNLGATAAAEALRELERTARAGSLGDADLLARIESELARARSALADFQTTAASA